MTTLEFKQIKNALKAWAIVPHWLRHTISIGQQIYMLRFALGMTQGQLAKRMGTSQRAIVRLEKEGGDCQVSTLKRLAESVNCELLIRFVPKIDIEKFLHEKARQKAESLVTMSAASANIEIQKPSKNTIGLEIRRLIEEILHKKRSSLWEE